MCGKCDANNGVGTVFLFVAFQVQPYLPYEYTCEGMLERVHAYIQHQVRSSLCHYKYTH